MYTDVQRFFDYVYASPTAFHAVQETAKRLSAAGYLPLNEGEAWNLKPGDRRYVTRNGSALIAFELPEDRLSSFRLVAAHADSPTLKLKEQAEDVSGPYLRLNVEKYGGLIMSTWLDRPLSVAGRLIVRTDNGLASRLVDLNRDAVLIPNLPIHFNREVNDGYAFNAQQDMLPLFGSQTDQGRLMGELADRAGVSPDAVLGSDLYLYSRVPGSVWGAAEEYFSIGRIDDLECAFTALDAFAAPHPLCTQANVFCLFDNEEVGSTSRQGADSTLLSDTLRRVCDSLGMSHSEALAAIAASFMISADNAHALHPNHPEKFDAQNRVYMNGGVVIKHSANQKYTTDGLSSAIMTEICARANVPCQHFANRSDILGGSTLGNIANTHASMPTVDIGLAQLAMHSSYETAGVRDLAYMTEALRTFYELPFAMDADSRYTLGG